MHLAQRIRLWLSLTEQRFYDMRVERCPPPCIRCTCSDGVASTSLLPAAEEWRCTFGLPYGWEMAVDTAGRMYYIK
jgi:hypothetical protein